MTTIQLLTVIFSLFGGGLAGGLANICYQEIRRRQEHKRRPRLAVLPYEHDAPYYRETLETDLAGSNPRRAYYVNIAVRNVGHRVARRCDPVVTAVGFKDADGKWRQNRNWIPVGLKWAVMEGIQKDLIPEPEEQLKAHTDLGPRYFFNLVKISEGHPDTFHLVLVVGLHAQPNLYKHGKYCFRVTVYVEEGDWTELWFYVSFVGGFGPSNLKVDSLPSPPWDASFDESRLWR